MRGYAREVAFCKIFAYIIAEDLDGDFSQFDKEKLTDEDLQFAQSLVEGVVEHKAELDGIISELSQSFKLDRIYRPDLAALELALYEMQHTDTPHPVVINEVVGIVKRYSTEKSVRYVNGILAAYERGLK
ncbi:MAG: transcription antitermination factor NusB [Clostridia bacterium]|nr:transcription antitermination factor NusB [Clostridia bacterium]MBR2966579.1 transcription antitermination factor NusB [Clostridia bacterium]